MKVARIFAITGLVGLMAIPQHETNQAAGAASASAMRSAVEQKIREAWQDFKDKKADAYAALLADDFTAVEIDGKGPHDKRSSVSEVAAGTLNSYTLNDLKVIPLGANAALATYTARVEGTMPDGKHVRSIVAATDVWVRQANEWKNLRYHESELR
jgi:ketosteroid isomerase-like protein